MYVYRRGRIIIRGEKPRTMKSTCQYQSNSHQCHMDCPGIDSGPRRKIPANKEFD